MKRILILGGSWFLGSTIAESALSLGLHVTTFRRGHTGSEIAGVELIRGDRTNPDDVLRLANSGPWDAVIDTSSYVPRETLALARALEPVADRYLLVSSVSVYTGWPVEPLSDESTILDCPADADADFGYDADPGPTRYGFGKAGCERAVLETFGPSRSVMLRPGVILGPREYVGRLEWWLRRIQRGGRVLAPGKPTTVIQPVDVRDVAAFVLDAAEQLTGSFNLTARSHETMGDLLGACRDITGSTAEFTWITDENWLVDQRIQQWTELPLWRTYAGAWAIDARRARDAGFRTRPIRHTVDDTWRWLNGGGKLIEHERAAELGISPDREAAILGLWDAYEANHCGA